MESDVLIALVYIEGSFDRPPVAFFISEFKSASRNQDDKLLLNMSREN